MIGRLLLVAGMVVGLGSDAFGQVPKAFCFAGARQSSCRAFMITEAGYARRIGVEPGPYGYTQGEDFLPSVAVGAMFNTGPKFAVGARVEAAAFGGVHVAAGPRVRLWLDRSAAVDLSPGLILINRGDASAVTLQASVMYRDLIGLTVQSFQAGQITAQPDGSFLAQRRRQTYAGVRLGSKLGVAGAAGGALAFLVVLGAFVITCSNSSCD